MTRFLLAGATALATMTGAAMAQSQMVPSPGAQYPGAQYPGAQAATVQTTSITSPPPGPVIVSSGATTGRAVHADGDQTAMSGTSSSDSAGGQSRTTITNTSYPLTAMVRTTRTSTSVVNGVATEIVTTTDTYPPWSEIPPQVKTATRTYVVGSR